jgi:triacylglycerol lipase
MVSLGHIAEATNKYPIVLVHGLSGWGRGEFLGFPYWGGLHGDFQEKLKSEGYQVFTAAVGPFSSNWDRACELYAQIKGGQVDYGANHSATYKHLRYGRNYTGFFPQWGTVVNGKIQKVHLIGHSMGGQTIRTLAQLLNGGTVGAPVQEDPKSHPLFAGGKDWVHSVTTVSTPNQGSTLADGLNNVIDLIEDAIGAVFGIAGVIGDTSKIVYDIKLDQWGFKPRAPDESIKAYIRRVLRSRLFEPGFRDFSGYDLTVYGAKELNAWVKTLPNVFYYSFVTLDTFLAKNPLLQTVALPNPLSMNPAVQPLAVFIGSRFTTGLGLPDSWLPNDGLVNIPSQYSDGKGQIVDFTGKSYRGKWNRFETLDFMDHLAIVGLKPQTSVYKIYKSHAALLYNLPAQEAIATSTLTSSAQEDLAGYAAPSELVKAIANARTEATQPQRDATVAQCLSTSDAQTKALCAQFFESALRPSA